MSLPDAAGIEADAQLTGERKRLLVLLTASPTAGC
jgi:hypothetical protein